MEKLRKLKKQKYVWINRSEWDNLLFFFYFHLKIGPTILISIPKTYRDYVTEDDLDQIKRLMDSANEGFFFHTFTPQLKTANYFFTIQSPWARGRMEMLMISQLVQESNPDLGFYERMLTEFVTDFKVTPNIYKGIYKDLLIQDHKEEVDKYYEIIREKVLDLSKKLQQAEIQTKGELITIQKLLDTKSIRIPSLIFEHIQNVPQKHPNCFIFYRIQKDTYEILLFPMDHNILLKVSVYLQNINPQTLKDVSTILISNNHDKVIYSSGLCTQGSLCIYEVYLKFIDDAFISELERKLQSIQNVAKVVFEKIEIRN